MKIRSINPATGELNGEYELMSRDEVFEKAGRTRAAYEHWRRTSTYERTELLKTLKRVLEGNKEKYAQMITREMGKPIIEARSEIKKCEEVCNYLSKHIEHLLRPEYVETEAMKSYISFEPLGTVLSIMPWNFPFNLPLRCAIPAMTAGNAVILRGSNFTPQCTMEIEKVFAEAGYPEHIFAAVITDNDTTNELISSRYVDGVSFTGSAEVGAKIATAAGRHVKKCVLELGGSDPFVVLEDADIKKASACLAESRLRNAGQTCTSGKRAIVVANKKYEFEQEIIEIARNYRIGDPLEESTQLGPLVSEESIEKLDRQIRESTERGAKLLYGGHRLARKGFYFEPTVVTDVTKGMRLFDEEVFGPIFVIVRAENEADAIRIANATDYGLGAVIYTSDLRRGEELAREIDAGMVTINGVVRSDPQMPFGGIKKSGHGRELSHHGIKEFMNVKNVKIYEE